MKLRALRLALLDEVLARELQRSFDRLRSAADQVDVRDARGRAADQRIGQFLGDRRREETRVRIGQRVDLRMHRGEHVGMPVSEARHRGTAGGVEIALSARVGDPAAVHRTPRSGTDRAAGDAGFSTRRAWTMIGATPAASLLLLASAYGVESIVGPRRAIASQTSRALPAASVQPSAPWPVFSTRLASVVRPMIGRPLGVAGRSPVHCRRSPSTVW